MSSYCAIQGVVKLKSEYIDEIKALYLRPDSHSSSVDGNVACYLFGVNISHYIETQFTEKAANGSFDDANFETGHLSFVSGFSTYQLEQFIEKVKSISDHYILYTIYESPAQISNEMVVIKNLEELKEYLPKFNDPNFIESEIPFEEFDKDGTYSYVEKQSYDQSFFGFHVENVWEYTES